MTDSTPDPDPCENCGCGIASDDVETEAVELDLGMDFSVMVRRHLEKHTRIDENDLIQKVELCPEKVVAYIEADGNTGA